MTYQGKAITVTVNEGIATLTFDLQGESVNKFNQLTLRELQEVGQQLTTDKTIKGLLVTSAKNVFIVGADITEFGELFDNNEEAVIAEQVYKVNTEIFNVIEDLPFPIVSVINGLALGGGFEMCLATDYRVMASTAQVGFPEVNLGIIPGYGGTVRTPRIIGGDNAVEWISGGKQYKAPAALAVGIVDAVVEPELLNEAAMDLLQKAIAGDFDYQQRRTEKCGPQLLDDIELMMAYTTGKAMVSQQSPKGMIAPITAAKTMEKHAKLSRDEALKIEGQQIAKLAKTEVSRNLINLYLADQVLIKTAKTYASGSAPVSQAAVLGAGIMGGGIAYQSASTGTPIIMKDIAQAGIDMGMSEAGSLLAKRVSRGRLTPEAMADTLSKITPTLSYEGIDAAELVVEAVVENAKVKKAVLSELENLVSADTIITSNTSTIPISELAGALKRPENFCGMHFFNPVHRMPLVEIIRGEKTSEQAIARTVSFALAMGKKPVVVNDCPGFLVNRILFAYFAGFVALLKEGADFLAVDKAAEKFGWPMGPAYLIDVVGIDTGVHAGAVMAEGFPDRMKQEYTTGMEVLLENSRLGEKNGKGFYSYEADKRGKVRKTYDESVRALLAPHVDSPKEFSEEEIIDRLMIPLCLESIRCLDDNIADNATELDMALLYGVGFPIFRGGAMRYVENMGLATFVAKADQYQHLGPLFHPTDSLRQLAASNGSLFA
ncbi:fatty acid oxidation complex subunit alpha FadB [Oceanicoccus sp. KOV_DT_Chl]|uniref:fatty acid oxidation complex subunit alpha FadB n=1 Tax=Oceanicoccus sp. KOV_DT_Chl TaxID=1904639 RepID=UPI000C7D710F|nr:fatty acid oxidation complex subunit alpha FadB [Oceanicoccus sp. KOV_DT_Chl]